MYLELFSKSMTKTIMILAIAAAFVAGTTVFGFISVYEAEAAPKKPCPPRCPVPPMNATLAQLVALNVQLDEINEKLVVIQDGIGTSPDISVDAAILAKAELLEIQDTTDEISDTAQLAINVLSLIID